MNIRIRNFLSNYVAVNGPTDSSVLIALSANRFSTSRQRICGNISFMICKAGTLSIIRNKPHSIVY